MIQNLDNMYISLDELAYHKDTINSYSMSRLDL